MSDSERYVRVIVRLLSIPVFVISLWIFWANLIALIVPDLILYSTIQSFNDKLAMTFMGLSLVIRDCS